MTARKYLLDIGFDDAHLPELFNNDDKSYYQIAELMEEYHQAKLKLLGIGDVVGRSEQLFCCDCKHFKAITYHDKMYCRDCMQKDRFTAK